MRRILNLYILREISLPFVMVLFILTFVLLMGRILQLMDLLINKASVSWISRNLSFC